MLLDSSPWQIALFLLLGIPSLFAAEHALLHKRDPRSATAWVAFALMFPLVGPLIYYLIGKNRIRTRIRRLQAPASPPLRLHLPTARPLEILPAYINLARLAESVTLRPLLPGNQVSLLVNGAEAYGAMLSAIRSARDYVYLSTYIFEVRDVGREFIEALIAAKRRGVEVRVLIDGIGKLYDVPTAARLLRRAGVPVCEFLPPRLLPPNLSINLRNHRKILVVDGREGFTGGMNIRGAHVVPEVEQARSILDLHFRLCGPVVEQLEDVFRYDWQFCLDGAADWPEPSTCALIVPGAACRAFDDGPSEEMDKLTRVLVGALALAQHSVRIVTPYFLPPRELVVALQTAALRGVDVSIIMPDNNNLPFVKWASAHMLQPLLASGVRIYYRLGPFLHTKLFLVDDYYALVGSANLDPRSLRLNFELQVEIYDEKTGRALVDYFVEQLSCSRPVREAELKARPYWQKVRDAIVWLASPYL